jgi:acetaldehyde dehydrogenase
MAKAAIIGSGNIGTDLMTKVVRGSTTLDLVAMAGIDPDSEGLERARRLGIATTHDGVHGLIGMDAFDVVDLVFDATSASAHRGNDAVLARYDMQMVDLTPAALGPYVVPVVNLDEQLGARNVNMVTCGGQATIPIVAAISAVAPVQYAEIVASIASRSAGPGTRANIDEFTETTAAGLRVVGGAAASKAIIVLNPAEPPLLMRDTVFCLVDEDASESDLAESIEAAVSDVQQYVPGYRLKQRVQFERFSSTRPLDAPSIGFKGGGLRVSVFLEVEGAADYLPAYAGNLDIMTAAALRTGERLIELRTPVSTPTR